MYRIICYTRNDIEFELTQSDKEEALLLGQVMFNAGYRKVDIFDENNMLIETICGI